MNSNAKKIGEIGAIEKFQNTNGFKKHVVIVGCKSVTRAHETKTDFVNGSSDLDDIDHPVVMKKTTSNWQRTSKSKSELKSESEDESVVAT